MMPQSGELAVRFSFQEGHVPDPVGWATFQAEVAKRQFHLKVDLIAIGGVPGIAVPVGEYRILIQGPERIAPLPMKITLRLEEGVTVAAYNLEVPDQGPGIYECVVMGLGLGEPSVLQCQVD